VGGTVAEYTGMFNSLGITAGGDGNVWFVEFTGLSSLVGRVTPSGVITEFPLIATSSGPTDITRGPDGNVWFAASNSETLGRVKPDGSMDDFSVPAGPSGIATGSDGNLWFTEYALAKIGRFVPP
jgi:virginiamycin B lyase